VPGTFRLNIGVLESGITDEMYESLVLLIDDAKPVSRHLIGLAISLEVRGSVYLGAATYQGETLTVYPYAPGPITVGGDALLFGAGTHLIDIMSVYP
jgi:P2-related tail formation protein